MNILPPLHDEQLTSPLKSTMASKGTNFVINLNITTHH